MRKSLIVVSSVVWGLGCGTSDHTPGLGTGGSGQSSAGSSGLSGSGGDTATGGAGGGTSGRAGKGGSSNAGSGNLAGSGDGATGGTSSGSGGKPNAGATGDEAGAGGAGLPPVAVTARRRIAAGEGITCALDEEANVVCWGDEGDAWASHTALSGAFQTLAMGPSATPEAVCAVDGAGMLSCADWIGGVGGKTRMLISACLPDAPVIDLAIDGDGVGSLAYVPMGGLPTSFPLNGNCIDFVAPTAAGSSTRVAIAQGHVCALSSDGDATCWKAGSNPSAEPTLSGPFKDVVVSFGKACGLTNDGQVHCWDDSGNEDESSTHLAAKANISGEAVVALASDNAGANLCALFESGRAICSQNFNSEVISGVALPASENLVELAVGLYHVCGIRGDRTVLCVPLACSNDCAAQIAPPSGFHTAP